MFEVPEIEHDWDLIENEAEFEECLRNKNVFYLEEEDDEIKSIITDASSDAAGHIYMVSKKGKEILIAEESEPELEEEEPEEFNCKDEYCNTFAPTNTSPYEIIQENSSNSENSTSDSGSDIEKGIYSDDEVPVAPQQQEKKAVSDKVAKAPLDKGTIPINFWEFTPKTSLRNSEIKQIKKMSLADISVIIPVQIAADKTGKWKKGHAFIDTGANMNFCKKEMISDWLYYPEGTRVDTMNGERRLHNFALNVQVKIGEKTIRTNFVQIDDAGHDIGLGSVTLDEIGPYTICKDVIVFRIGQEQQMVPRLSASFKSMQSKGKKGENRDREHNKTLLQIMKQELDFEKEVEMIKAIRAINLLPGQRIDCLPEFQLERTDTWRPFPKPPTPSLSVADSLPREIPPCLPSCHVVPKNLGAIGAFPLRRQRRKASERNAQAFPYPSLEGRTKELAPFLTRCHVSTCGLQLSSFQKRRQRRRERRAAHKSCLLGTLLALGLILLLRS
ncbi:hypothetical protein EJ110_NYTH40815 [Nymphaea thermarum]|nr:hypothetical protein EJ110_NYTH40815 [Nymphaea thermarum]